MPNQSSVACRRRQNAEYRALGPGGGGFDAATFDDVGNDLEPEQTLPCQNKTGIYFAPVYSLIACQMHRQHLKRLVSE